MFIKLLLAVLGVSLDVEWKLLPSCVVLGLLIAGTSLAVEHGLCSTGSVATAECPGLVAPWPVELSWTRDRTGAPASAGRLLSTGPPGKPNALPS